MSAPRTLVEDLARYMDLEAFIAKRVGAERREKYKARREIAMKRARACVRFLKRPENRARLDAYVGPLAERNHPGLNPGHPHALDDMAYADGVPKPARLLELEESDPFWRTLGGSVDDPFGDGGETFRQREAYRKLKEEPKP
jgi:hypothetical protein